MLGIELHNEGCTTRLVFCEEVVHEACLVVGRHSEGRLAAQRADYVRIRRRSVSGGVTVVAGVKEASIVLLCPLRDMPPPQPGTFTVQSVLSIDLCFVLTVSQRKRGCIIVPYPRSALPFALVRSSSAPSRRSEEGQEAERLCGQARQRNGRATRRVRLRTHLTLTERTNISPFSGRHFAESITELHAQSLQLAARPETLSAYNIRLYPLSIERSALIAQAALEEKNALDHIQISYNEEREKVEAEYKRGQERIRERLLEGIEERRKRAREEKDGDGTVGGMVSASVGSSAC